MPLCGGQPLSLPGNGRQASACWDCLSALAFHELTTQLPHAVWLALAQGMRAPQLAIRRYGWCGFPAQR
jgi:hypothetical protein